MGSIISRNDFPEMLRARNMCDILMHFLPEFLKPYILHNLHLHLCQMRAPDMFLLDSRGERLRFDPDNEPAPPQAQCFRTFKKSNFGGILGAHNNK